MMTTKEERQAHLHWATTNTQQPCFCSKSVIDFDVLKLKASPETIAAIFGIRRPERIRLHEQTSGQLVLLSLLSPLVQKATNTTSDNGENKKDDMVWPIEPKRDYEVRVVDDDDDDDDTTDEEPVVPINQIFHLFPGTDDDAKSNRIQDLSNNFYKKLWDESDEDSNTTPADLRKMFFSRTSSAQIQAYRQYDFFHETFGGPSMMDCYHREKYLIPKVMAQHTSSRMTRTLAISWLNVMNKTLEEEFPNEKKLKSALSLYWLHFYGFFPFSDDDRKEFRRIVSNV